ncbi:MAG: cytochrome c oxidase assembly protein [Egibacteraceae bacterium]
MLTPISAHVGQPLAPHDLWSTWNTDPLLIAGLVLVAWAYLRGTSRLATARAGLFLAALGALGVALLSPLDALSGALASAHMIQHVLLVLVAAPLLALSAPTSTILRGTPLRLRRALLRARRPFRSWVVAVVRRPAAVWLLHVAALWCWHAAALYDAALQFPLLHAVEHASFLLTGLLFWQAVVGRRNPVRLSPGLGIIVVFAMALQGVVLSLLMTFARAPWYGYEQLATTASPWPLDPLADQQLAGVIMWIPGGMVYLAAALVLLVTWIHSTDEDRTRKRRIGVDLGGTIAQRVRPSCSDR